MISPDIVTLVPIALLPSSASRHGGGLSGRSAGGIAPDPSLTESLS